MALEDPAERVKVAYDNFGRSGAKLITLFPAVQKGFAGITAEAEKLGLVVSRDQALAIERANDAWTRVGKTFQGVGRQLAVEMAPIIEEIANHFMSWLDSIGGVKRIVEDLVKFFRQIGQSIDNARVAFNAFAAEVSLGGFGAAAPTVVDGQRVQFISGGVGGAPAMVPLGPADVAGQGRF